MSSKTFLYLTTAVFLLLLGRLFWLTVVQNNYYHNLSQENRIKVLYESVARGIVFDQNGSVLVRNTPLGRQYNNPEVLAHIIGYIGQADSDDLSANDYLVLGDEVGKTGIEKEYDYLLTGQKAERLVEVDTDGSIVRELGFKEGRSGRDLRLSLDLGLQTAADEAFGDKTGAVIVSTPEGKIMALVSKPSFDPNIFTLKEVDGKEEKINRLFTDERQPIFNRAIAGLYPPGSTFKPVMAVAGLASGHITAATEYEDVGNLCFGEWCFGTWYYLQYGKKEGMVNLVKAIQRSNDIYFYQVGRTIGINVMADWAKNFGFTRRSGIDLPGESEGLFPSAEWKEEAKGEAWYLGDTIITSIGQGNILATPIQVHMMTSVIANKGQYCQPKLLADYQDLYDREKWVEPAKTECRDLNIKPEYIALITEGMRLACEPGGTGWPLFNFGIGGESTASAGFRPISTACKTGTAEIGDPQDKTHAWFVVFSPAENPEIVVTVLAEKAGEGSAESAPVAQKILKYYFSSKK